MNKLITMAELHRSTAPELRAMFRKVSQNLVRTERYSRERQNALASLENINRALNSSRWRAGGF